MAKYYSLGSYDRQGVPTYLESIDTVLPSTLDRILLAVPERVNIPIDRPNYISDSVTRNILIQSTDEGFEGADVYMTFLFEGAGYRNTVGYYHYPLNGDLKVPSKLQNNTYVPMTYSDRNAVNGSGKSILNKTIVFPNASLPTWANSNGKNSQAGGGNLYPGSKVRLVYDTTKPELPFPNNTGIGFFVIPNGWNGSTYVDWGESVHTDSIFNANKSVQTIPLFDTQLSTEGIGRTVISFEDIMRPAGDQDFNDIIVQIDYTPRSCVRIDDFIFLPDADPITKDEIAIDKTGIYYCMKSSTVTDFLKNPADEFEFVHIIEIDNEHEHRTTLKQVFKDLIMSNDGHVDDDDEEFSSEENIVIKYKIKKNKLQNCTYFVNPFINRGITSPINEYVSALVELQNIYMIDERKQIKNQRLIIRDSNKKTKIKDDDDIKPHVKNGGHTYCLGDPHIKTIYNYKYDLPNDQNIYQLYNDGTTTINTKLDTFYMNESINELKDLTFMHYLGIDIKNLAHLIVDMYHPDTYYILDEVSGEYRKISKDEIDSTFKVYNAEDLPQVASKNYSEYVKLTNTNQFILKYINFKTPQLGNTFIELLYITHRKDLVNSMSIISNNLLMTPAKGALISPKHVRTVDNIV